MTGIDRLTPRLVACGLDLDADHLLEALWLATTVDLRGLHPASSVDRPDAGTDRPLRAPSGEKPIAPQPARPAPAPASGAHPSTAGPTAAAGEVDLSLPAAERRPAEPAAPRSSRGGQAGQPRSLPRLSAGTPLRVRTASALPGTLELIRALRPVKRRVPSRHRRHIDEQLTARWIAERRTWLPQTRPVPDRWLDLILVLDHSSVANVWGRLGFELQAMLEQLGAFRTIRVRHLAVRPDDTISLSTGRRLGVAATPPPPAIHAGAAHDQVILLVSDGVARVWHTGVIGRLLARWARHAAVAVLQPLPDHLWHRTGLRPTEGLLHPVAAGAPTTRYRFTPRWPDEPLPAGATAVPILELDPDRLRPWANLVAGEAVHGVDAVVTAAGATAPPAVAPALSPVASADPVALVQTFRGGATAEAFRLARYLAAAVPLNVAVMRLVQAVVLPGSPPASLAEVVYGGLLEPAPTVAGGGPDDQQYEFVPGVRDVLLDTLTRTEGRWVVDAVSRYIEQRVNQVGASFAALASLPAGGAPAPGLRQPFARIHAHVLRRLTGKPWPVPPIEEIPTLDTPPGTGQPPARLTVLHLPDPWRTIAGPGADLRPDPTERARDLLADLATRPPVGCGVDLVVVTGNLAETARPAEYERAYEFLQALRAGLDLDHSRIVIVPGLLDANEGRSRLYFQDRQAGSAEPTLPYWPKWQPLVAMQTRLGGTVLEPDRPWHLTELPTLRTVVAGLNSTITVSHREADRYGWLGPDQLSWFAERLHGYRRRGWLRLGVLHHDPTADPGGAAGIRDATDLADRLASRVDLLLHGYRGEVRELRDTGVSVIGAGAGSGYQLVDLRPGTLRATQRPPERWLGAWDTGGAGHGLGDHWWHPAPEPDDPAAATPIAAADSLLDRVAEVYRVRHPEAAAARHPWPGRRPPEYAGYLLLTELGEHGRSPVSCVGVYDAAPNRDAVAGFRSQVLERVPDGGPDRDALLICRDDPDHELRDWAGGFGVRVLGFPAFQLGDELARYARRQAAELERDATVQSGHYVPQRYREPDADPDAQPRGDPLPDLLGRVREWFAKPRGVAVGVVGAPGQGKTCLLRELARRMHADRDPAVPILVDLQRLDAALAARPDELIAVQLSRGGERRINLLEIRYLLREGRLALLCDGLDDLVAAAGRSGVRIRWDEWGRILAEHGRIVLVSRDRSLIGGIANLVDPYMAPVHRRLVALEDFNHQQALALFRQRLGPGPADEHFTLLRRVEGLLTGARSPRTLGWLATVDGERLRAAVAGTGRVTLARLYEEMITIWLAAELGRSWRGFLPGLSTAQLQRVLTALAVRLWVSGETALDADLLGAAADLLARLTGRGDRWRAGRTEAARLLAAGTLLTPDRADRFTFVDRSVQQWLVARDIADRIRAGGATVALAGTPHRAMPP
ncbi:MAG: NACHT domain-containing protein, partial [Dactylosporangium sp.]|nr:NACHT domain-containing protein [Dactylosporangium sp.]NNJ62709.1 NACHT domain-containing protein [Dactylosporangium sp.]